MTVLRAAIRSFALLLCVLLPQQAPAETLRHGQGLLWHVVKDGQPVGHVFGTIHMSDADVLALPPVVLDAFGAAKSLSVEVILDGSAVQTLAMAMALPPDQRLDAMVPADLFKKAVAASAPYGLQAAHLARLKPWAVALLISVPPDEQARRAQGALALDSWLEKQAQKQGKKIHALETIAEQVTVFEGLSQEDQVAQLKSASIALAEKQSFFEEMKKAYLRQDLDEIHRLSRRNIEPGDERLHEALEERLFHVRNRKMAERMVARFEEGGAFVAIGALHLPGETGVLRLLEQRGYTVTRKY
jgi:uncharacterized protein YbaP (TraB family)